MINPYWPWSHGLVFCGKESFFDIKGFNEELKHGELREFFKKIKCRYKRINSYVEPSDRRIKKWGILKSSSYWILKKNKEEYGAVR
ncbi:MAG: hypothetical protein AABX49_01445, partial [Nanoarchaeota archaeon]